MKGLQMLLGTFGLDAEDIQNQVDAAVSDAKNMVQHLINQNDEILHRQKRIEKMLETLMPKSDVVTLPNGDENGPGN